MRRFGDLTKEDQKLAFERSLGAVLAGLVSGEIRLDDKTNGDNCQSVIDRLVEKARKENDMRLAVGWIMEATYKDRSGTQKPLGEEVSAMARAEAEESWYPDGRDKLIFLQGVA